MASVRRQRRDGDPPGKPSGRYQALYLDPQGRQRSAGTFTSKRQAAEAAQDAEARIRSRTWIDPTGPRTRFDEWVQLWQAGRMVRASTRRKDEAMLNARLLPAFGAMQLGAIRAEDVRAWVAAFDGAPEYVASVHALLRTILGAAVEGRLLDHNPAARISTPEVTHDHRVFLTEQQLAAFVERFSGSDRTLIHLAAWTGLRWGEVIGLRVSDLALERAMLTVNQRIDQRGEVGPPKSRRSKRSLSLDPVTVRLLREQVGDREAGLVFTHAGEAVRHSLWWHRTWLPAVDGFTPRPRFHDLRHTHASVLLARGVDVAVVSARLGHAKPSITYDRYRHLLPGEDSRAVAAITAAITDLSRDAGLDLPKADAGGVG